mgnify:CR=1 FL=1
MICRYSCRVIEFRMRAPKPSVRCGSMTASADSFTTSISTSSLRKVSRRRWNWIAVTAAITGATLITVRGGVVSLHTADLLGLASGITAGVGVMSLRQIRKTDSTFNVLFFTFLLGTLVSLLLIVFESLIAGMPALSAYPARFWYLLLLSGFCGVAGQWVFTYGFAYVGAVEGSILSSTRILIALAFGLAWFGESFTAAAGVGAVLVLFSNVALALKRPTP